MFRCITGQRPPESTSRLSQIHNGRADSMLERIRDEREKLEPLFADVLE